jgi:long-chain acyl-CoA synthetase
MSLSEAHHSLTVIDHVGTELLSSEVARDIGGRIMTAIERLGERPHNFVVFQASNSAYLLAGVFGALLGGFAPVVISEKLSLLETHDILSDLPHSIILSDSKLTEFAHSAKSELVERSDRFSCRPMHFTSGTSGRPKGVWSGWLMSGQSEDLARDEREAWGLTESDVHLVSGPLSHSAPLRFALHTLLNGGMVAVQKRFDAHTASDLIEDGLVTTAFMAPVHLQRILDSAPPRSSSLRLVAHAGSPCPNRVRLAAIDHFGLDGLFEFYGSTEGQFTLCGAREWREHLGTVGRARPGRDLRTDEEGRIWCKAPPYARFTYWGDSEKTRTAWQEDWFTVGDLGRLDSLGYLYLDGRRTDLVISGGVNVYPAEIERALSEMPGIESIAAFGVEDSQWGQRVCVAYVGSATEQEILDHCLRALAPYKHPRSITRVVELPRTHTGKIDRTALPTLIET